MNNNYDAIIIGAGMSGLAAGIRLAMFDKKVIILEKHIISGGLNSFYSRRVKETKEMLEFDVGLHALTNFAKKGERRKPLTKLLKQLRISYDELHLKEQTHSLIKFESCELRFANDFGVLTEEIASKFPHEIDAFERFVDYVETYNEVDLNAKYIPARDVLKTYFKTQLLQEMLLAPLLIYGSAWENDMDFSQFVIMFKSIYLEGFSRPVGGVRTIIELLEDKFKSVGGEISFRSEVKSIVTNDKKVKGVELKNGEFLTSDKIFSSAGLPETYSFIDEVPETIKKPETGKMSFMETIIVTEDKKLLKDFDATIVFYNKSDVYQYQKPKTLFDDSSSVFCLPDNYERENLTGHGVLRSTYMANYELWCNLSKEEYKVEKEKVFKSANNLAKNILGLENYQVIFKDVFSPKTILRYTGHFGGTVYGSTTKSRDGRTDFNGLYTIGTDQGFLGIVGSMLSGISMANLHGLME
jgi:phytoene dehydrogenase-like protein